jgi:iron complex outermembrane receptor protein
MTRSRRRKLQGAVFKHFKQVHIQLASTMLAAVVSSAFASVGNVNEDEATSEKGGDTVAEIVVTAQRREQNLQDVGTSITALDAGALARLGITDATDIARQVPGVQFNAYAPTITVFNIRGVSQNDYGDHQEAPVAVYEDDVYVASMGAIAGNLYDLDRVEVLRGPQGTLFGRNATGGLIHYISTKPSLDSDGYFQITGSRFTTFQTEGAVNLKMGDNSALRVSFATDNSDGYMENRIGPTAANANNYSGRLQYLVRFADSGELLFKMYGTWNLNERIQPYSWLGAKPDAQGLGVALTATDTYWGTCPGCDPTGYRNPSTDVFNQASSRTGVFDRSLYGTTIHATSSVVGMTLASITDFQYMYKLYNDPSDPSPTPLFIFYNTEQRYHQFSQELHLSGQTESVRWIGGAYFLDIDTTHHVSIVLDPSAGGTFGDDYAIRTRSWALFGQTEWDFAPHLTGIIGARYTQDQKRDDYTVWQGTPAAPVYNYSPANTPLADRTFHLPSWKAELDFKPLRDVLLYGSVSRGVKSGGWAQPVFPTDPTLLAFNPERLTSYEIGLKSTLLDGRMRFNSSAFYYDYRDYQVFLQENLSQVIGNRNARVKGGEAEVTFIPARGWDVGLGISGLSTVVKNVTLPDLEVADRVLPQAPKWSVNAEVGYQWPMLGGTMSARADMKWDDAYYFSAFNAPIDYEPSHAVSNARLGYTDSAGKWNVTAFVRNFTDRRYRVYDLDLSSLGYASPVYAPPRWWGLTAAYHW